jgi:hypothetical protein
MASMSLSTSSSMATPYAASGSDGGCARAIESIPATIVAGVESIGEAVGDVASATVSFSAKALQALEDGGMAMLHGAEDVITYPFELAKDAAVGAEHLVEDGWQALSNGVSAIASGVSSAAHTIAVDLPNAVAANVADAAKTAVDDAASIAGAAAAVVGGAKMIGALL